MTESRPSQRFVLSALRFYRNSLSIIMLPSCRFVPSCSAYAEEVVLRYGAMRGLSKAIRRLLRCRPGNPGGVDLP